MELRRKDAKLDFGNARENIERVLAWACRTYPEIAALSERKKYIAADMFVSEAIEFAGAYRPSHLSLKRDRYSSRYCLYGYRPVKEVVDLLGRMGLHDVELGEFDLRLGKGNETTVKGTRRIMEQVLALIDLNAKAQPYPESIVLKNRADKALKEYNDVDQTVEMRCQVGRINDRLNSQVLFDGDGNQLHIQPGSRQFLDDFETGGGFFYSLQNTPKADRQQWRLLIGGEKRPTVELDFEAMHLGMLYAMVGSTPPEGDPYEIAGHQRKLTKRTFNTLVNAGTSQEAAGSISHDIYRDKDGLRSACGLPSKTTIGDQSDENMILEICDQRAADVIRATKIKHKKLKRYFGSDIGVKLQKIQADIMLEVCDRVIAKTGRSPYPIHDGCRVADIDVEVCRATMVEVAREYGLNLKVKVTSQTQGLSPAPEVGSRCQGTPTTSADHMGEHGPDLPLSDTPELATITPTLPINAPSKPPDRERHPPPVMIPTPQPNHRIEMLMADATEQLEHALSELDADTLLARYCQLHLNEPSAHTDAFPGWWREVLAIEHAVRRWAPSWRWEPEQRVTYFRYRASVAVKAAAEQEKQRKREVRRALKGLKRMERWHASDR